MCQFKSGIILKDKIFIPDYNSHTEMLNELKIEDTRKNAEKLFIRAELLPPKNDVFAPIDEWSFTVDQDILPEWYVASYDEQRMRDAVKEWAKTHIHRGVDNLRIASGKEHYIKDCKNVSVCGSASINEVCGSASINKVCGSASINEVCGSASIKYVCGSASINEVCDSASIKYVCDSASINEVYGSASINEVYGSASIKYVYGSAIVASSPYFDWNKKGKIIISQNATFKDNRTKIIWQSGDWKMQIVRGEK